MNPKLCIVPVGATAEMVKSAIDAYYSDDSCMGVVIEAAIAARPPLDAEMQVALEVARITMDAMKRDEGRHPELIPYPIQKEAAILARALLRANGEDV